MLTKHSEIEITTENPFANDKLQRQKIIENLTLLVQSTSQPFVISIEAPWGQGKTTFIKMWKAHLENVGHICLYFNAWESDFVEDPLIAFIGELSNAIDAKNTKGKLGGQLKKLQNIGGKIVKRALPLTIQIATQGLLTQENVKKVSDTLFSSGDEIANFASELAEEKIKQYDSDKKGLVEFKKQLSALAASLSDDKNKKSPLIFFIDELDRCRPDFSISLLERIKHVFSVNNVVFILGIDRDQIEQSIKSIYGQGMNADGYLRRFIDYGFRLPSPSSEKFCEFLYTRFVMDEIFKTQRNGREQQDTFLRLVSKFSLLYGFSLRTIEQYFTEMNLVLRTIPTDHFLFSEMIAFLLAIKIHDHTLYSLLSENTPDGLQYSDIQKIIEQIRSGFDMNDRLFRWLLPRIHANLIFDYLDRTMRGEEYRAAVNTIQQMAKNDDNPLEKQFAETTIQYLEKFEFDSNEGRGLKFTQIRLSLIQNIVNNPA
jgi:hypothetical protein